MSDDDDDDEWGEVNPSSSDSGVWESIMSSSRAGSGAEPRPKTVLL